MSELTIRSPSDIFKFIDAHPADSKTWLITLVALGGIFVDAYDFASLGVGIVQLKGTFHLSPMAVGSVTAIMALGACLGGILGGGYIDRLGRFKILLLNVALLVVAAIGAALSVNFTMLLAFRFLMGIGVGLDFPVALSYVSEVVNVKSKNSSVSGWQVMWYLAASCSGLVILPFYYGHFGDHLWRIAIGFGAVPALIVLLLRYRFADESPRWAARNLPLAEAGRVIAKTYKITVNVISNTTTVRAESKPELATLFRPPYLKRTLLASIICATQAIEYFSVGFNIPSISQSIFGKDFVYAILGALFFNVFGIVGSVIGALLAGPVGIRRLSMLGYCMVAASLITLGLDQSHLSVTALAALIGCVLLGHSIGPGQGMSIATLSYPSEMRGLGSGWGQGMARGGSILGFFMFPLVMASAGMAHTMLVIAVVPIVGLISCLLINWDPTKFAVEGVQEHNDAPYRVSQDIA